MVKGGGQLQGWQDDRENVIGANFEPGFGIVIWLRGVWSELNQHFQARGRLGKPDLHAPTENCGSCYLAMKR